MGARPKLSVPERRKVVLSLIRREEPAGVLARRCGISENTLYRWRDDFLAAGEAALMHSRNKADARDRQIAELNKQLVERDKVIGELTIANRILKETTDDLY
ncbi:MAG: helix-turn-helix domain-containing protein [Planctomycetota bacterium]|jgi:transposase-like protein